jgi:hypothetical protein
LCEKFVTAVSANGRTRRGEFALVVFSVLLQQFLGRVLKYFDELITDQFSLSFGIGHAFQQCEEAIACVDVF